MSILQKNIIFFLYKGHLLKKLQVYPKKIKGKRMILLCIICYYADKDEKNETNPIKSHKGTNE